MRLAVALTIAALAAPAFASGGSLYILKMETVEPSADAGHRGQIEVVSYSWSPAQAHGNDHELEMDVPAGRAQPPPSGASAKFGVISGAHRDSSRTSVGGDPDRPVVAGSVPDAGAAREGKLQTLRARAVADIDKPPHGRSSVWIRVATPWAACRVGARYPAMTLSGNGRGHRLEDVRVSSCAADRIGLHAERIRAWDKVQE